MHVNSGFVDVAGQRSEIGVWEKSRNRRPRADGRSMQGDKPKVLMRSGRQAQTALVDGALMHIRTPTDGWRIMKYVKVPDGIRAGCPELAGPFGCSLAKRNKELVCD